MRCCTMYKCGRVHMRVYNMADSFGGIYMRACVQSVVYSTVMMGFIITKRNILLRALLWFAVAGYLVCNRSVL